MSIHTVAEVILVAIRAQNTAHRADVEAEEATADGGKGADGIYVVDFLYMLVGGFVENGLLLGLTIIFALYFLRVAGDECTAEIRKRREASLELAKRVILWILCGGALRVILAWPLRVASCAKARRKAFTVSGFYVSTINSRQHVARQCVGLRVSLS